MKKITNINPQDLKDIEEVFEELDSLHVRRQMQNERKKMIQARNERLWRKAEERAFPKKLRMAKAIFKWAEDFRNTAIFRRIEKFIDHTTSYAGVGENFKLDGQSLPHLKIYFSSWGHRRYLSHDGGWAYLYLFKGGFYYKSGYKYVSSGPRKHLGSPLEFAQFLSLEYIKKLYEEISTGKIVKKLVNKFKNEISHQKEWMGLKEVQGEPLLPEDF